MKTLAVDDDYDIRLVLQCALAPYGVCDTASCGEEAVRLFVKAWDEGKPYDLIVLDIMMPGMDGNQVLHTIRNAEFQRHADESHQARIIMVTALSDKQNAATAFREQCEAFFVKPLSLEDLLAKIEAMGLISRLAP
ncbi:MAG: response regulator [Candidatus Sumerlaeota bacterium]|nr:response regulator [Candidatus Sumerlaeota bacterium]